MHLALDEVAGADGFLPTRLWDNNSSIVDGHYLSFHIDKVDQASFAPVPKPPTASIPTLTEWGMIVKALLLAGVGFHYLRGRDVAA